MNKSELVAAMAAKTGESKASQERSLEAMLEAVTEALASVHILCDSATKLPQRWAGDFRT